MAQGLLTVTNVAVVVATPTQYDLTCTSIGSVAVDDHVSGELSDGTDAVYKVLSAGGSVIRVEDSLTEGNVASGSPAEFGTPAAGSMSYGTPLGVLLMTMLPEGARGWRAALLRNSALVAAATARSIRETDGPTVLTVGDILDGEFVKRDGATLIGDAGSTAAHKDTHKSGEADAFTSADLIEAQVRRILESGGQVLTVGAIADGQVAQRSGTNLIGANVAATTVLTGTQCGRLSASSSGSTGEESSGVDDLYFLRHCGAQIALYDGSSAWSYHTIPAVGVSFDVSADNDLDAAAIAVDSNYDVFLYNNASTLELHLKKWTNDTTRVALAVQDGVLVRSGATAYRYLGTVRTVDVSSAPKIVDHGRRRFIWNLQNQVTRRNQTGDSTVSYSIAANTADRTLNNADPDGFHHEFVTGLERGFKAEFTTLSQSSAAPNSSLYYCYVALDGSEGADASRKWPRRHQCVSNTEDMTPCLHSALVAEGYHAWKARESTTAGGSAFTVFLDSFGSFYSEGEW